MKVSFLLLFAIAGNVRLFSQNPPLFVAPVKNKSGYIDTAGRMVIAARFRNAGEFSEGPGGRSGKWPLWFYQRRRRIRVLPPAYDVAQKFEGGIAKVYIDGAPIFIDHLGRQVLPAGIDRVEARR